MASMLKAIRHSVTRKPAPRREALIEMEQLLRTATCFTITCDGKAVTFYDPRAAERFSNVLTDLASGAHGEQWWC